MSDDDFASRLCAILISRKAFLEDSTPHRMLYDVAKEFFPHVREAIRAEAQKEVEPGRATPIPVRLPDRK